MQHKNPWLMCVMAFLFLNNIAKELVPELLHIALSSKLIEVGCMRKRILNQHMYSAF